MKNDYVTDILGASYWRSLLIQGDWGCGKTFIVRDFYRKNSQYQCKYISLFGIETANQFLSILKEFLSPQDFQISNNNILINDNLSKDRNLTYNNLPVIIIDDLERIESKKFSYEVLFGIINKLVLCGYRVVCICGEIKSEFLTVKEKLVDFYCKIHEPLDSAVREIIGNDLNVSFAEIKKIIKNNLRILIRTKDNFDILKQRLVTINDNYLEYLEMDEANLFLCALYAYRCINGYSSEDVSEKIKNDFYKLRYNEWVDLFGWNVANELFEIYRGKLVNSKMLEVIEFLVGYILTGDESFFRQVQANEDEGILGKIYFYLSDEEKREYINAFIEKINTYDFKDHTKLNLLADILFQTQFHDFSKQDLNKICSKLLKDYGTSNEVFEILKIMRIRSSDEYDEKIYNYINDYLHLKRASILEDNIENIVQYSRNYTKLSEIIADVERKDEYLKKKFGEILFNNNFFLPNLDKTISSASWSYCHKVCSYVSENSDNELKLQLHKILKVNAETSSSLSGKNRWKSLDKQYFYYFKD